jgi:hypothetical protein
MTNMGKKHNLTFDAITSKPDRHDIEWDDFLALLVFLGAKIKNQSGPAIGVRLNGIYAVFHKPHPGREIYPSDLKRIRRFFEEAGIGKVE